MKKIITSIMLMSMTYAFAQDIAVKNKNAEKQRPEPTAVQKEEAPVAIEGMTKSQVEKQSREEQSQQARAFAEST